MGADLETRLSLALHKPDQCQKGTRKSPCAGDTAHVVCPWCDDHYYRCEAHDGAKGAKRSLTAHKGICRHAPPKMSVQP